MRGEAVTQHNTWLCLPYFQQWIERGWTFFRTSIFFFGVTCTLWRGWDILRGEIYILTTPLIFNSDFMYWRCGVTRHHTWGQWQQHLLLSLSSVESTVITTPHHWCIKWLMCNMSILANEIKLTFLYQFLSTVVLYLSIVYFIIFIIVIIIIVLL